MNLNSSLLGPLSKDHQILTPLPFVLCIGNHSSGKSTFINHVVGRDVQVTGVAPTDDSFTVIAPGSEDLDQDGHALIGDPDMGFSALRDFGPGLLSHVKLKVRNDLRTKDVMLIDSPGMIDSPVEKYVSVPLNKDGAPPKEHDTLEGILHDSNISKRNYGGRGYAFPEGREDAFTKLFLFERGFIKLFLFELVCTFH